MMSKILALTLACVALWIAAPQTAEAQLIGGYRGSSDNPNGPTVSPYLNLLQSNQFGVTNYQSLVRPLIDQSTAINRQGNSLNRLQQQFNSQPAATSAGGPVQTGRPSFFMFYSHFYAQPGQ
ncbi:MAG: hypothetical protein DWQ37_05455 [Planctomycetota bacterium]|nr:MAG: hypothetical protein DWQ37_05455 [Planctomycetota bacterium]